MQLVTAQQLAGQLHSRQEVGQSLRCAVNAILVLLAQCQRLGVVFITDHPCAVLLCCVCVQGKTQLLYPEPRDVFPSELLEHHPF